MEFRKHFDYDVEAASNAAVVIDDSPSLTVQSMAEDTDLNVIMRRFGVTGQMPDNPRLPVYGDFTGITDYKSALMAVMDASEHFMELPATVRARFDNDPQKLLEFVSSDGNREEAEKLGLLKPVVPRDAELFEERKRGEAKQGGSGVAGSQGPAPGQAVGGSGSAAPGAAQ